MKVAIVADAHLFQTFAENYDSVGDLGRALDDIKTRISPDVLFLAGDMFDYMKTETIYLRHYEGEGYMVRVRDIFRDFEKPIYAIRGNHDKEEVLRGLEQTVDNFHHQTGAKNFEDFSACFMDSFYETGGYSPATLENIENFLKQEATKLKEWGNKSVLLCHETFAPYDNALPESVIEVMKKNFDVVLNGHMHLWNPNCYKSSRIICLPSLLPSKIAKGKYASERYVWSREKPIFEITQLNAPFGYVILDTDTLSVEFQEFVPSKKIIEVVLDVTDLQLEDARKRLRTIFSELDHRPDKDKLIVLPVLEGEIVFSRLFLESVREEFPGLFIESIRDNAKPKAVISLGIMLTLSKLFDLPLFLDEATDRFDYITLPNVFRYVNTLYKNSSGPQVCFVSYRTLNIERNQNILDAIRDWRIYLIERKDKLQKQIRSVSDVREIMAQ